MERDLSQRSILFSALFITVLYSAVLCVFKYPPLLDYSNHLARMHIFAHQSHPDFEPYFFFQISVPTNLAMDVLVPILDLVLPLSVAGKAFLILIIAASVFAPLFLSRILLGRCTAISLVAAVFAFNAAFLMGFVNFLFSAALAMYAFGFYVWMDRRQSPTSYKILIGSVLSILVFLSHIYGFAAYAICIGAHYLWRYGLKDIKRLVLHAAQFIPVSVLLAVFVAASVSDGAVPAPETPSVLLAADRLEAAPLPTLPNEDVQAIGPVQSANWIPPLIQEAWKKLTKLWLQYGGFFWLPLGFVAGLITLYVRHRVWPFEKAFFAPVAALIAFALFLPTTLWGAWNVDWRFLVPATILAAGLCADLNGHWRAQAAIVAGTLALAILQSGLVLDRLIKADAHQNSVISVMSDIPAGARVFAIVPSGTPAQAEHPVPFSHMATLGVIENNAFVPSLFASSIQQPLRYRAPFDALASGPFYPNLERVNWSLVAQEYEYILIIDHDGRVGGAAADWFLRVPIEADEIKAPSAHVAMARIAN